MATIREYFDTDARVLTSHADWDTRTADGQLVASLRAKVAMDFEANARYWYFFIPQQADLIGCINSVLAQPETAQCMLTTEGDGVYVEIGLAGYSEHQTNTTLVFTRRIFMYVDAELNVEGRRAITELGTTLGFQIVVRDRVFAKTRSELQKPLAFISHDSRDKDGLVRELAAEMIRLMCPVWYDEYSLKVGDSLRANIEKGLKEVRKCVVILSPHFLSNGGWGRAEFDSVFTREMLERSDVILPVWHNVDAHDVYQYSPRLADKVGLPSSLGVKELARRLSVAVKAGT